MALGTSRSLPSGEALLQESERLGGKFQTRLSKKLPKLVESTCIVLLLLNLAALQDCNQNIQIQTVHNLNRPEKIYRHDEKGKIKLSQTN